MCAVLMRVHTTKRGRIEGRSRSIRATIERKVAEEMEERRRLECGPMPR